MTAPGEAERLTAEEPQEFERYPVLAAWIEALANGEHLTLEGWCDFLSDLNAALAMARASLRPLPGGDRERFARIIASELNRQDYEPDSTPETVHFSSELTWSYLDQGAVDFGQIADAIIAALQKADTP